MTFSVRPFSVTTRTTLSGTPPGTLTQLPILTMPGDDIGHPIPDLTGYITEGQIVLDRELDRRGIYPPIKVLPRLSRLMDADTDEGYTHADHPALAHQLFAAYTRAVRVRTLASVMGEQGLPEAHRAFLALGKRFENDLLQQAGSRTLENVSLPEIDESLRYIEEPLDAMDQEEALRVRNAAGGRY